MQILPCLATPQVIQLNPLLHNDPSQVNQSMQSLKGLPPQQLLQINQLASSGQNAKGLQGVQTSTGVQSAQSSQPSPNTKVVQGFQTRLPCKVPQNTYVEGIAQEDMKNAEIILSKLQNEWNYMNFPFIKKSTTLKHNANSKKIEHINYVNKQKYCTTPEDLLFSIGKKILPNNKYFSPVNATPFPITKETIM